VLEHRLIRASLGRTARRQRLPLGFTKQDVESPFDLGALEHAPPSDETQAASLDRIDQGIVSFAPISTGTLPSLETRRVRTTS